MMAGAMTFRCRMCGSCCMSMGYCIAIDEQTGPFEFACSLVSTGTPFTARIDGDKRDLFLDRSFHDGHPDACPFLRPSGELVVCTIHETSPAPCRFYRCVVMRILDGHGILAGTVTGTLALHSEDRELRRIWEGALAGIPEGSMGAEERLRRAVEDAGYRVE